MRISEAVRSSVPHMLNDDGSFVGRADFDIGFINPEIKGYQPDGIANDETCFIADSINDLEELYRDFCKENNFPQDTVVYVNPVEREFTVDYIVRGHAYYTVSAATKEEALKLAEKKWAEDDFGSLTDADYSGPYSIEDSGEVEYLS